MRCNTVFANSKYRMAAVVAVRGGTARPWRTFIARLTDVTEIRAARPLHEISANSRHIAKLSGSAREQRVGKERVSLANQRMMSDGAVPCQRTDSHSACRGFSYLLEGKAVHVDQLRRSFHVQLHEIDQAGAAGDKPAL